MSETPANAPSQEIQKISPGAQATLDRLRGTGGKGLEKFDTSDMETPRLVLLQPTSPQVTDFENARPGMFWHSVMNEPVGDIKSGFEGVIAFINKRAILWRPRPPVDLGGILARSDDLRTWNPSNAVFDDVKMKSGRTVVWRTMRSVEESRLLEWGTSDPADEKSLPAASLMHEIVLVFPDYMHFPPAVFSFQRSSLPVGRRLVGWLNFSAIASYGYRLRFGSNLVDAGGNKYYVPTFERIGYVEDQDLITRCEVLHNVLTKLGLKVKDVEEEHDSGIPANTNVEGVTY